MKRLFTRYLSEWKNRTYRKPLIVRGARQVGKTYSIVEFGRENFNNYIKINFEEEPDTKDFFQNFDIQNIINNIEVYSGQKVQAGKTLIFLDEIQNCPKAIVALRYFYEKMPELHVIAAGSLLDFTLNNFPYSMPVGRIEFAYMYPLNFKEFLLALNENSLLNYIENYQLGQQIPSAIHNKLLHFLRQYFFIGGMPEAVKVFSETKSFLDIERIHESIIKSFEFDFSRYRTQNRQEIITKMLKYVPKSTGQKFKYANFDNNLRAESIKKVLNLLNMSRIIHIIYSTNASGLPLEEGVSGKVFKLLFMDIGLLNHILGLSLTNTDDLVTINEGKLAEQFIGQELLQSGAEFTEKKVYYWTREKRNAEAEIDFLTQISNKIIPIEVKAGKTGRLKSLHVFAAEKKINQAVRFNTDFPSTTTVETQIKIEKQMKNVKFELVSLPLYLVSEFQKFL